VLHIGVVRSSYKYNYNFIPQPSAVIQKSFLLIQCPHFALKSMRMVAVCLVLLILSKRNVSFIVSTVIVIITFCWPYWFK
jgi:hypothetical protein